ncbi:ShlB/FhaC/HecB family hemolysin secretion/activation protein [Sphingosinicella sp. LHD-64]|uniref:ShlB/FhaC/HecB family hemolysin secretion/activation protein n=1 Tax=Sphingosinicella sp. LHD-64 TaxID=3072139 RepID=UPI00280DA7DA|nr:ShlB/FhaC/HecB family hemolysin secretion/activation protein [Sphingosinicella sp. LHD-64]MDQ8757551.1 ShlB/FhaC/HecB family hemolysin secretion/activation protein [Sphingosinicella sp. LHD-64]
MTTGGAALLAALSGAPPAHAQEAAASRQGAADGSQLSAAGPAPEPATRFDIRAFQVRGNTILAPNAVERAVYPFMGPGRTSEDVEAARAALQKAFEDAGYVAVSVFIPEQSVEGGILMLEVQPQAIGQVLVEGAHDPDAIRAQAPSLAPGQTPNLTEFQRDVVAMNQIPSRRVTPELRAGVAPGTLDVLLGVEETSPFHALAELNNFSSAATSELRASGTLRHDNLWGRGDSLSLSVQIPPERPEDGIVFSGNYLTRLGTGTQLLLYGVHSDSDIAVVGGTSVIGRGNIFGARLIRSLGSREGFYHSLTAGVDWKDFGEDVILGADRDSVPIEYFPFTAAWRGDWTGDGSQSDLTLTAVFGIRGIGDGLERFLDKRFQARPSFFAAKLDASHTGDIPAGLQFYSRFTGQWSPDPLISNEQFSLGGMSSVRGYFESEMMGDWGFALQTELRSPELFGGTGSLNSLRLHAFVDSGFAGIHRALPGQTRRESLMSTGLGARVRLLDFFNGALDVGVPLLSGPDSGSGDLFARFRIWGEF